MSGLGNIISQRVKNDDFDERKATIRRVFMAHGFTIKDGQTDLKPYVYEAAEALLRELSPAVAVPEGYALVPVEPTPEMVAAGAEGDSQFYDHASFVYRAMLAAAQKGGA